MKVVKKDLNILILRYAVKAWIIGSILALIGLSLIIGFSPFGGISISGVILTLTGVYLFIESEIVHIVLDKTHSVFTMKRQKLLGTKVIQHQIREIADVQVENDDDGSYRVSIVLVSAKRIPLTPYLPGVTDNQENADMIRQFLNLAN
ncbi:hypothetical protein ACSQ6I_11330 [Anabaena sp. WFMT]|uniref:hypothetical protein n=1 Tax=Anabaena sp. WFMT TaxID=3449730 RepID=UPI003F29B817